MMRKIISAQRRRGQIFFQDNKVRHTGNEIVEVFKQIYSTNVADKKEDPKEYHSNR